MLPWLYGTRDEPDVIPPKRVNSPKSPPLTVRWNSTQNPLPTRLLHPTYDGVIRSLGETPAPWLPTGPEDEPFDFCGHIRRLTENIIASCDEFAALDASRLLIAVTQARNNRQHGLQARVTPMRFRDGALTRKHRGATYQVQRYFHDDREILYIITFCLPRYLEQDFDDKLTTLIHELYHLNPSCNGDLRRHDGRYEYHSHSRKHYDRQMAGRAREYLSKNPDPDLHAFLRLNFNQLCHRHGSILGVVVPRPKVVRIDK